MNCKFCLANKLEEINNNEGLQVIRLFCSLCKTIYYKEERGDKDLGYRIDIIYKEKQFLFDYYVITNYIQIWCITSQYRYNGNFDGDMGITPSNAADMLGMILTYS